MCIWFQTLEQENTFFKGHVFLLDFKKIYKKQLAIYCWLKTAKLSLFRRDQINAHTVYGGIFSYLFAADRLSIFTTFFIRIGAYLPQSQL